MDTLPPPNPDPDLTQRQEAFCRHLAAGASGAAAARRAGYAPGAAAQHASRLLRDPRIQQRVARHFEAREEAREAARAALVKRLERLAASAHYVGAFGAELRALEFQARLDGLLDPVPVFPDLTDPSENPDDDGPLPEEPPEEPPPSPPPPPEPDPTPEPTPEPTPKPVYPKDPTRPISREQSGDIAFQLLTELGTAPTSPFPGEPPTGAEQRVNLKRNGALIRHLNWHMDNFRGTKAEQQAEAAHYQQAARRQMSADAHE